MFFVCLFIFFTVCLSAVGRPGGPGGLQSLGSFSYDRTGSGRAGYEPSDWLNSLSMKTEAGEVIKRRRTNGPWFPEGDNAGRTRGSAELALSVAANPVRAKNALKQFESLMFNSGTVATKDSLFALWTKLCQALGFSSLPLSRESIIEVAAVLRTSGYRSVMAYIYEARARHVRSGYAWSGMLDSALADCKRAATRAMGPSTKALEIKLEWWVDLVKRHGWIPFSDEQSSDAPSGGVRAWVLATLFLLRETELAALTVDTACIRIDHVALTVGLHLSVQKNDPTAKGAWRSLGCTCSVEPLTCPFHIVQGLINEQLQTVGLQRLDEVQLGTCPLIGRCGQPTLFVEKAAVITELQRCVQVLGQSFPDLELDRERVTGHTFRRSGAKHLARKGLAFSDIQWMARHSSSATWGYVEEAWQEAPRQSFRLHDASHVSELLTGFASRLNQAESAIKVCENDCSSARPLAVPDTMWKFDNQFKAECRRALIPLKVCNLRSLKLHDVCRESCLAGDPRNWTTKCGWKWMLATGSCKTYFESDEIPNTLQYCEKCNDIAG